MGGRTALIALGAAALLGGSGAAQEEGQEERRFFGLAFVFRADLEHARAVGWAAPGTSDDALLEAIEDTLRARVRNVSYFVEAEVAREEDRRFAVTFVGPMGDAYEKLARDGLTNPGRIELRVVATDADVAGDLAAERARLARWRERHPERAVATFGARADGGADPAVQWLEDHGGERAPVPVLRAARHRLVRADMVSGLRPRRGDDGTMSVSFTVGGEAADALRAFVGEHPGREIATVLNDRVLSRRELAVPESGEDVPLQLAGALDLGELRALLMAVAGEPLAAPLRFVERGKRELVHAKDNPLKIK